MPGRRRAYFCGDESPSRLGICRAFFYAWFLLQLWIYQPLEYSRLPSEFWDPVSILKMLDAPSLDVMEAVHNALILSLLFASIGLLTRLATILSALLGTFSIGVMNSYGLADFHWSPLIVASWILAVSRCGDAFSLDAMWKKSAVEREPASYCWPFRLTQITLVAFMFSAGCQKLRGGWLLHPAEIMRYFLRFKYFQQAKMKGVDLPEFTLWLSDRKWLLAAAGVMVVALEIGSVFALVDRWRWPRRVLIGGLFLMQASLSLWLRTLASFPWLAMYVFWPRWDEMRQTSHMADWRATNAQSSWRWRSSRTPR